MEGRKRKERDTQDPISRREELFVFMSRFVYMGIFRNNYYKNNFPSGISCSLVGASFVVDLKHAYQGNELIQQNCTLSTVKSKFSEIGT